MTFPIYRVDEVTPLQNENYYALLIDAISKAKTRIWCVSFIVDIRPKSDIYKSVIALIKNLEYARWRNVDVKIILGDSTSVPDIRFANQTTASFLESKKISTRMFENTNRTSLHSKYVIVDHDLLILGSHNWTSSAFHKSDEDSVAIRSVPLVSLAAAEFLILWNGSLEVSVYENPVV